jgi:hypothetical protein
MSLQLAAQHLASRGRGPDTTLVHMAPQEVAGLHALAKAHGGSLTTNPDTGLPEAGFLSSILPMVIGAGLTVASGGALTPLMAAGITGAGYGLAKGSLAEGLRAGLGAYGGAGLMGGLLGAGTGALSSAAGTAATNAVPTVAPAAFETAGAAAANTGANSAFDVLTGGFNAADPGLGLGYTPSPIQAGQAVQAVAPQTVTGMPALTQQAADIGNSYAQEQAAQNAVAQRLATATPGETMRAGLDALKANPSQFMTKDNLQYGLAALGPAMMQSPEQAQRGSDEAMRYKFDYNPVSDPQAGYTGATTGERRYFNPTFTRMAEGGPIEAMSQRNQMETVAANGGMHLASGGVSNLGDYSDGGRMLRGPGDGVSDSIPASIAGKRPAKLADGEFVIPARIVSELGNGSSEAGARKLYAMMDRVQKARGRTTGQDRVAVNSRAEKLLPA